MQGTCLGRVVVVLRSTATWVLSLQEDDVGVRLRDVIGADNMDAGPRLPAQQIDASP